MTKETKAGSPQQIGESLRVGMTEEAHARVKRTMARLCEVIEGWRERAEKAEAELRDSDALNHAMTCKVTPCSRCAELGVNGEAGAPRKPK
jgi:hypothetical protein